MFMFWEEKGFPCLKRFALLQDDVSGQLKPGYELIRDFWLEKYNCLLTWSPFLIPLPVAILKPTNLPKKNILLRTTYICKLSHKTRVV